MCHEQDSLLDYTRKHTRSASATWAIFELATRPICGFQATIPAQIFGAEPSERCYLPCQVHVEDIGRKYLRTAIIQYLAQSTLLDYLCTLRYNR